MRTGTRTVRLERLFASHQAVSATTREAINQVPDQACILPTETFSTPDAKTGRFRCVRMTTAEAHALLRMAIPPSARTVPTRKEHALLMISIAQLLDELASIDNDTVPWSAIAAAQHLAVQVRDWLVLNNQVVMGPMDKMSDSMAGRERTPDAVNRVPKPRKSALAMLPLGFPPSWHNDASGRPNQASPKTFPWQKPENSQAMAVKRSNDNGG